MLVQDYRSLFEKHFSFWEHLSEREQDVFCRNIKAQHFAKGENVHSGSNDCIGLLFVKSGQLRTYMLSEDGREVTLYRLTQGDTCALSASCIIQSITFDVFIDAEEESDVFIINVNFFNQLFKENIYVENFVHKLLSIRFSEVMWAMQQILFMSFDKRLATFLLHEFESKDTDTIKITHEQVAKHVGSAREVVSRMLKYFEGEGIVRLSRGGITILSKEKLQYIAQ